jgi:NADH dehydrogenase FAD-containing subunit
MNSAVLLEKRFGSDPNVTITLVIRDNFFLFAPMLNEVAASDLATKHIVSSIRYSSRSNPRVSWLTEGCRFESRPITQCFQQLTAMVEI